MRRGGDDRGSVRTLILVTLALLLLLSIAAGGAAFWGYLYITRDLPSFEAIEQYAPPAVSRVYAEDGTLIAEFFKERRYPARLSEIPPLVRNCFLAAEDAAFYSHPGINPLSILRALMKNLQTGTAKQGGSTITQQVVKNLLLTPEKKLERKIKEAILSYRLEQVFTKDQILELYLNQIYFGNTAYGIKAATRAYFHKEPAEITLAEAAMLAGLPQAPSRYSPINHFQRAQRRQEYVLQRMVEAGFITKDAARAAAKEELSVYTASVDNIYHAPFYVAEVRRLFLDRWRDRDLDGGGLEIHTALDLKAYQFAQTAMQRGLRDVDKRRGWRGPREYLETVDEGVYRERFGSELPGEAPEVDTVYPALVLKLNPGTGSAEVLVGARHATVDLRKAVWAKKLLNSEDQVRWGAPDELLRPGAVIDVVWEPGAAAGPGRYQLDQIPEIEGASIVLDPHSGKVVSVIGGFSYQRSQFNRATQGLRQPGSAFKPIVYLAAVDGFHYTPSTIVYDEPQTYRVGDQFWSPGNFDEHYLGPITLRNALEKSRNLVSANIVAGIGVDAVIEYARKLGIEAKLGRNPSLSLGSGELTMVELARAYGIFAARGVLMPTALIMRVADRNGQTVYDYETERLTLARQAVNENSAFIMTNMLKGVIQSGTGQRVKALERPVAGKTGTSNDQMDAWFVGFTPNWVAAVWVGFDAKREIGDKETGGRVAAPIFIETMKPFLEYRDGMDYERMKTDAQTEAERLGIPYLDPPALEPLDFSVPEGVDPFWVDKQSGLLAEPNVPGAILEYFMRGTEPRRGTDTESAGGYLDAPEL